MKQSSIKRCRDKKPHKKSIKGLVVKLDGVFSKYIRLRDKCICITCGKRDILSKMDCGHYITRQCRATRWDEKNCACQCQHDNRYLEGVKDVFALKLQKKYGDNILQELNDKKNQIFKVSPEWLEDKINYYKKEIEKLGG
jgi:hypothetical protein